MNSLFELIAPDRYMFKVSCLRMGGVRDGMGCRLDDGWNEVFKQTKLKGGSFVVFEIISDKTFHINVFHEDGIEFILPGPNQLFLNYQSSNQGSSSQNPIPLDEQADDSKIVFHMNVPAEKLVNWIFKFLFYLQVYLKFAFHSVFRLALLPRLMPMIECQSLWSIPKVVKRKWDFMLSGRIWNSDIG